MKHAKTLKWLLRLCCLLAVLGAFSLAAHAETIVASGACGIVDKAKGLDGSQVTWTLDAAGTLTISGTGAMNEYDTDYYRDYTTAPWGGSVANAERVKNVVIKNGVTRIGSDAFYRCTGLTSVTIGNGVTSIGIYAFANCTGLTSVTIPDSVTSIRNNAFHGCTGLTSVTIPDGVTSIGNAAFYGCKGLMSVTIPDSVTSIGASAFYYCTGLTSVTIGNGVTSIGGDAFSGCGNFNIYYTGTSEQWKAIRNDSGKTPSYYECLLENGLVFNHEKTMILTVYDTTIQNVTIPDSVTSIGEWAFSGCTGLTSVTIPDSVTDIGHKAFSYCTGLTSVTIPDGVTSVGNSAFSGCTGLTAVTIPDSVKIIGDEAFSGCTGLTSVAIPDSVTSIREYVFYNCTGLTSVTIPDSVTSIGKSAFSGCTGLESGTIPDSVTSIENAAFSGCTGLISVTIGKGVTNIGNSAFSGCTGLKKVYINSLKAWCNIQFDDESSNPLTHAHHLHWKGSEVTDVVISTSVTSIRAYVFCGCSGLKSVTIPDSVTSIGKSAFSGCTGLESGTIPDSVTSIENAAFSGCTGLTSVTIPDSVTGIGGQAFYGCTGLDSITIGNGVTSIDNTAFSGCTAIRSLTIGRTIENYALAEHQFPVAALEEINLLDSVTGFAAGAFKDCVKVTFIDIPDGTTTINTDAFSGCTELASIVLPGSVTTIKNNAFYNDSKLKTVVFDGTEQQWKDVLIEDGNIALLRADVIFLPEVSADPKTHSPHIWHSGKVIKAATCAETGEKECICIICGAKDTEVIAKTTEHTWDDGVITTAATCTKDGVKTYTCTDCGATKTETIPATGHSYGAWEKLDDAQHQRVCANDLTHTETASHTWDKGTVTKTPTCTEAGEMTYNCTGCGATVTVPGDAALGHNWSGWTNLDGTLHKRVCANNPTHVETAAHSWDDGTVTKEPTDKEEGVKTFTCTVCGAEKTEPIPKTEQKTMPGDADGDGKLTSADARLALRASVGLKEPGDVEKGSAAYLACDVDGDGKVTSADARLILRASVGLEKLS